MSDDLVAFLRARLDEDEQASRHASAGPWTKQVGYIAGGPDGRVRVAQQAQAWNAAHIARHDPARVLADIDAKRYVIDQCAYWNERAAREAVDPPKWPQPGLDIGLLLDAMNPILRGLALPYADHPDYRQEWRP